MKTRYQIWFEKNRERRQAYWKQYNVTHARDRRAYHKARWADPATRDKQRMRCAKWRRDNREAYRYARKLGVSMAEARELIRQQDEKKHGHRTPTRSSPQNCQHANR